jgi:prepilin-type N-terminal cleavage/methylation domain-containing protein
MIDNRPIRLVDSIKLTSNQTGFSLLETLVALAILVLVLGVSMQIFGSGARSSRLSYEYAQAINIAQSKLAEMKLGLNKQSSGTELDKYHWQTERKKANYSDLGLDQHYQQFYGLYDVSVTVVWQSGNRQQQVDIKTVQLENQR